MSTSTPLLEIQNLYKHFPGVQALEDVSLSVNAGELMALLGENGAGKSTLVKILSGAYVRDSGVIRVGGNELPLQFSPASARNLGIAIIYQELKLLPNLTVAENIYLTREPRSSKLLSTIDYPRMNELAREQLAKLKAEHIAPTAKVRTLSLPEKQMVEIASALSLDCRVIIMDEPTTSLTWEETNRLFEVVRALKQQNVTIIYISHRLDEIFAIADRATILRDGHIVGSVSIAETSTDAIIELMTGRKIERSQNAIDESPAEDRRELLRVEQFDDGKLIHDIQFTVYENEVLGIAGLVGSGRTELARMIFGADKKYSGSLYFMGQPIDIHSPLQAVSAGIGYLSENRKEEGLNLGLTIRDNIISTDYTSVSRYGVLNAGKIRAVTERFIQSTQIKGAAANRASSLSGGNQQKVVLSKWLHAGCRLLIFDEPTRGVDVGAKAEIHSLIREFATEGRSAIVISSEVDELVGICDRVLVMSKGRIIETLQRAQISKDELLQRVTKGQ